MNEQEKNMQLMATDDTGVQGPNADNSPPWLNSIEATSAVVRKFASDVVRFYGVIDHQDFMKWLSSECARMNSLFIGDGLPETMPYTRGIWNTPDQLGHHLALAMHLDGEMQFAARDAFMVFASQLGELMRGHQEEAQLPALQKALDKAVASFSTVLLGLDGVEA